MVTGLVATGKLARDDVVYFMNCGYREMSARVRSIEEHMEILIEPQPGQYIGINLAGTFFRVILALLLHSILILW